MSGEQAYGDLDNFSIDNEPKQKQTRQIPASETNQTVEEFQSQIQMQVSHALNNVSEKSDLEEIGLRIQEHVAQMGARVLEELSKNITDLMNTISRKLESLPRPECRNSPCPDSWIPFNGSCYLFSAMKASWSASQRYCSIRQSHLLVINTIEEQHFVTMEIKSKEFWFGLNDHSTEGKWEWVDGTDYKTTTKFWAAGEPNNANSGEDCAQTDASGRWNDNHCSKNLFFICEQEARSA
ncbi:hepatic lectin-like isoform X2 [Mustelus asterias]